MKLFFVLMICSFALTVHAQNVFSKQITNAIEAAQLLASFEGKEGSGGIVINGKTVLGNVPCYSFVEDVDVNNSDYQLSALILKLFVFDKASHKSNELSTNLASWDFKKVIQHNFPGNKVHLQYSYKKNSSCVVTVALYVIKNKHVDYEETQVCNNGTKKTAMAVCKY